MTTESALIANKTKIDFIQRFISTLGDPAFWEHNGEVNELDKPTGKCACGHAIRYEYVIIQKVTNQRKTLGSECINNFKEYNIELFDKLTASCTKMKEAIAERERAVKLLLLEAEVAVLKTDFDKKYAALKEYFYAERASGRRVPWQIWTLLNNSRIGMPARPPKYKSTKLFINWFKKNIKTIDSICAENNLNLFN